MLFSFKGKANYHDWVEKESGPSSVELENLPPGIYKLYRFNAGGGFRGPLIKLVIVGSGTFIPTQ